MKNLIAILVISGILSTSMLFAQQNNQRMRNRNRSLPQISEANAAKWADIQAKLKQQYPEEYAAIEKTASVNLALATQKMCELARKANMKLPGNNPRMRRMQDNGSRPDFNAPDEFGRENFPRPGNRKMQFGRMPPNQRLEAEKKIKAAYPAEYAAIEKQKDDAENKLQALAKKANVKLPMSQEDMMKKMAEIRVKYKDELAEINKLRENDPEAARERMQAIMKKEGIEFPNMGGMGRLDRNNSNADVPKPERRKFNSPQQQLKLIREAYPEEMKQAEQLRQTDPEAYKAAIRKLARKYNKEHPQR